MNAKRLLPAVLILAGCGEPTVTKRPTVLGLPPPAPDIPVVQRRQQPIPPVQPANRMNPYAQALACPPQMQPQPAPNFGQQPAGQQQQDPTPIFQEVFSKYAAEVSKLEQATQAISYKDTKRRNKYYWTPLNEVAEGLQSDYSINAELLARIIQLGLDEKWPTAAPEDAAACAKMVRRYNTEHALAVRRANSQIGMSMLDHLIGTALQQIVTTASRQQAAFEMWARRQVTPPGMRLP